MNIYDEYKYHPEFLGIEISSPNQRSALDSTLLHIAARTGRVEHVKLLVEMGAQVNAIGDMGYTPLHDAALAKQRQSVELLLKLGADRSIRDEDGNTAADIARLNGDAELERLLRTTAGK